MERTSVLLATQRALLNMITPNMKAITIGYSKNAFTLRVYFSSKPTEEELELLSEITTEVAAHIPDFLDFKEESIVTDASPNKLERLNEWVYMQYSSTS